MKAQIFLAKKNPGIMAIPKVNTGGTDSHEEKKKSVINKEIV